MRQIKSPIITEKTLKLASENNCYTFEVVLASDKLSAAREIEALYGVTVEFIRSHTRLGKPYGVGKFRQLQRRKPSKKIMIFKLKAGDKIEEFKA